MNTSRRPRVLLGSLLVLVVLLATGLGASWISGCASLEGEGWNPVAAHKALPPYYLVSDDVEASCGFYNGLLTHGCARRDYASGLCFITTGPNPPQWLRVHEERHCAGFSHNAPTVIPYIAFRR